MAIHWSVRKSSQKQNNKIWPKLCQLQTTTLKKHPKDIIKGAKVNIVRYKQIMIKTAKKEISGKKQLLRQS